MGGVGKAETDFLPLARSALFLQRSRYIPFQVICDSFISGQNDGRKESTHVKYILSLTPLAIDIVAKEGEKDRAHHTCVA